MDDFTAKADSGNLWLESALQHAEPTAKMELLAKQDDFCYHLFSHDNMPTIGDIIRLTNESWMHDYAKSKQAIFKYDEDYLAWFMQENTANGLWVTKMDGTPVGIMLLAKRTMYFREELIPSYYAALFSVSKEYRKYGIGRKMFELMIYLVAPRTGRLFMGALDGESNGKKLSETFLRKEREKGGLHYWQAFSTPRLLWAATENIHLLHSYMPFAGIIAKIALHPQVRKLIEFRYRTPASRDYELELVAPSGFTYKKTFNGCGFTFDTTIKTLYRPDRPHIAGVYRVAFFSGRFCEIYYNRHLITKMGMKDNYIGHIQFIDRGTARPFEVLRTIKIVNHQLFRLGCIMVLTQNLGMVPLTSLIRAGYLPSNRKIRYHAGCATSTSPRPVNLRRKLFFDLI